MATSQEIREKFAVLSGHLQDVVGADLQGTDRAKANALAQIALQLLESTLVDLNRSADAFESLAMSANGIWERMVHR